MLPISRIPVATILSIITLQYASAVVVNFSAGENYVGGNIETQTAAGNPWDVVNGSATTFVVNPPGLTLSPSSTGQAIYQTGQDYGLGAITTYVDFSFTQNSLSSTTDTNRSVIGVQYLTNPSSTNLNSMVALFGRTDAVATPYRIALGGATAASFAETNIGINVANSDFTSDTLRLSMTITRTGTTDTWTRTMTLTNLTTSTAVASITSGGAITFTTTPASGAYTDASLYASIQDYAIAATQLDALSVSSFGIIQVPEPGILTVSAVGLLGLLRRRRR